MLRKKISLIISILTVLSVQSFPQSSTDVNKKNDDRQQILKSGIKSKSVWEYNFRSGSEGIIADSGYKTHYFSFDNFGRITEYTRHRIFSDLTVKEIYTYGKTDKINRAVKYNSAGDIVETIDFKYNSRSLLKKQIHTAYFNGIKPGVHFSINANVNEDKLFLKIQHDLEIEPPLESFTIVVNISDDEEENQYAVIGDESDITSPRYAWSQLSLESQQGLLSYTGPNRKEHLYITKKIALAVYKYDAKDNLTEKSVYNTSNDLIEKESFSYNTANHKTGYFKYNEDGKTTTMESYSYDAEGRLSETTGLEPNGKATGRNVYKYDDKNKLIEKTWFRSGGEINGKYKFIYDGDRLSEEIKFRGENEIEYRLIYKYDEKGNVTEITRYDANEKTDKIIRYVYEFY